MQSLRQKAEHPYKGGEISPGSRLHTAAGGGVIWKPSKAANISAKEISSPFRGPVYPK